MIEVEPDRAHPYVPPHRYEYQNRRVNLRPLDWPLGPGDAGPGAC